MLPLLSVECPVEWQYLACLNEEPAYLSEMADIDTAQFWKEGEQRIRKDSKKWMEEMLQLDCKVRWIVFNENFMFIPL